MKLYVKTRGTTADYRFLGPVPRRQWWASVSGRYLVEEKPAVAVSGEGLTWSAAIFGIPSGRRDFRLRAIRYSLILEAGPAESDLAARCARLALDEGARDALGARLDQVYPADLVDAALRTPPEADLPDAERVLQLVREVAAELPGAEAEPASPMIPPWIGSASDADAVAAFLAHARRLARGQRGICFTSRGLSTIEQARQAVTRLGQQIAILALDARFGGVQRLGSSAPTSSGAKSKVPVTAAISTGLGLGVLLLIIWVLRNV